MAGLHSNGILMWANKCVLQVTPRQLTLSRLYTDILSGFSFRRSIWFTDMVLVNGLERTPDSSLQALRAALTFHSLSPSGSKSKCLHRFSITRSSRNLKSFMQRLSSTNLTWPVSQRQLIWRYLHLRRSNSYITFLICRMPLGVPAAFVFVLALTNNSAQMVQGEQVWLKRM